MCERKKTRVLGTLLMLLKALSSFFLELLCKTLNSRMNIKETRAVSNIIKKNGKCAPDPKNNPKVLLSVKLKFDKLLYTNFIL